MHFKNEKLFNEVIITQKNIIQSLYKIIEMNKHQQFLMEISSIFKSLYNEAKNINYLNTLIGQDLLQTNVKTFKNFLAFSIFFFIFNENFE